MLKLEYFTEHTQQKAVFAVTGTAGSMLVERFCLDFPLLCALAQAHVGLFALIGMMALDMVTGMLAARTEGTRLNSRRMGEGAKRKVGMLAVIAGALLVGSVFETHGFPVREVLYRSATSWFIGVEFLSLYENADRMGVRMPTFLKTAVERVLQKAAKDVEAVIPSQEV